MRILRAIIGIVRLPSSLLAVASVLLPLLVRTNDVRLSLQRALPLLFGSMCTFIVNDLDDAEKDKINHPDRPLPSGELQPGFVAVFYYFCLASALLSIRFGIEAHRIAFFYYVGIAVAISYRYVVEYLPFLKPVYVSLTSTGPVIIIVQFYPREVTLYAVALAIFFFMLGREMCKDLPDRRGDRESFLHKIDPHHVAIISGVCQAAGILLVALRVETLLGALNIFLMTVLVVVSYVYWLRWGQLAMALGLMKGVLFLGLFFLL